MLYHGSYIKELPYIAANAKSHYTGKQVAYFTSDRVYALVCCRLPEENFVTMGIREDGKQHYFERFPNQLITLYKGKKGFLYILDSNEGLVNTNNRTWESNVNVYVDRCEIVDDVYEEIKKEEEKGNIVIHKYEKIDSEEQKAHANHIRDTIDDNKIMKPFYLKHFSSLWDKQQEF